MEQAQQLAGVLRDAAERCRPRSTASIASTASTSAWPRSGELEQEGDRIYRAALAALFDGAIDPMFVLRWKDIYSALEEGDRSLPDGRQQHREHRRQALVGADRAVAPAVPRGRRRPARPAARAVDAPRGASGPRGREAARRPGTSDRSLAGGQVQVEAQRVEVRPLVGGAPSGSEVVVDVEQATMSRTGATIRCSEVRRRPGDHVGVTDVEAEPDGGRGEPAGESPDRERIGRDRLGTGVDRREVLEREHHAEPLGGRARGQTAIVSRPAAGPGRRGRRRPSGRGRRPARRRIRRRRRACRPAPGRPSARRREGRREHAAIDVDRSRRGLPQPRGHDGCSCGCRRARRGAGPGSGRVRSRPIRSPRASRGRATTRRGR